MQHDPLLRVCAQLVKLDNRTNGALAEDMNLSYETIRRLRRGDTQWARSTTLAKIVKACHKEFVVK